MIIELDEEETKKLKQAINDYLVAKMEQNDSEYGLCAEEIIEILMEKGV